jgi:hypothetical protein
MPWATVAKAIIEVTSNTAANVFDIMALSDFLWRALFGTNRKSLRRQPAKGAPIKPKSSNYKWVRY